MEVKAPSGSGRRVTESTATQLSTDQLGQFRRLTIGLGDQVSRIDPGRGELPVHVASG
jgi:hypothetical protein